MSLLFSKVEVSTESESAEFLMGGIPRDEDDLKGWLAYENFAEAVEDKTEITVHAEAYLYGGGETVQRPLKNSPISTAVSPEIRISFRNAATTLKMWIMPTLSRPMKTNIMII